MEGVKARREHDIVSDYYVVVAKMELKLKKHWPAGGTSSQKFDLAFLRHTDRLNEFKKGLNNRLKASQDLLKEDETSVGGNHTRYHRSTNVNVSGGFESQKASS
ncbi:unnamed protein product [Schistosoma mattheei]|uniref:Uncharacterized protein n=1 Tax=Schistosoma mattheei TaxID=31246 RepID=A0A183PR52_9TREM|nr:unnamed protein product [Schistosoma mattheei]